MADLSQEAFGRTSSGPTGIAQQASGPVSSDRGKLRVFISYSRDDLKFADQLDAALTLYGFECLIDRHGISGGEDWKRRLGNLISDADTVVFVLSPSSARSDICAWEVEESARLNKRILPIICRALEGANPPPRLRDLNYIFFYEEPKVSDSGFGTGLVSLVAALNTDFDWLREHTRYLQRAMEWDKGGQPANRLLSGNDIVEAKTWATRRPNGAPEPTALQLDFIRASEDEAEARLSEQRKQLEAMASAQAEREKAQDEREEAFKQVADAQRKRARIRNIAFVVVSIFAVFAGWLYWRADKLRQVAEEQRAVAEEQRAAARVEKEYSNQILTDATRVFLEVLDQTDVATKERVFKVFKSGADRGDVFSVRNLGLLYLRGWGVRADYDKAFELFEKAAEKGDTGAMAYLGQGYENGRGVSRDEDKAREWYEKAAAKDDGLGMVFLGLLYENGRGVPQDYCKALEWYEKAFEKRDASALAYLGKAYFYGTGVQQDRLKAFDWLKRAAAWGDRSAKIELELVSRKYALANEKARALPEGRRTASELRCALFAKDFMKAVILADRAHEFDPHSLFIEANRAYAFMFWGRGEEAKALYLAHKGKSVFEADDKLWERVIAEGFEEFRKAGMTHPMMADIEKELGISPDGNSNIGKR